MSGLFHNLAARARGELPTLRPRLASRFEPLDSPGLGWERDEPLAPVDEPTTADEFAVEAELGSQPLRPAHPPTREPVDRAGQPASPARLAPAGRAPRPDRVVQDAGNSEDGRWGAGAAGVAGLGDAPAPGWRGAPPENARAVAPWAAMWPAPADPAPRSGEDSALAGPSQIFDGLSHFAAAVMPVTGLAPGGVAPARPELAGGRSSRTLSELTPRWGPAERRASGKHASAARRLPGAVEVTRALADPTPPAQPLGRHVERGAPESEPAGHVEGWPVVATLRVGPALMGAAAPFVAGAPPTPVPGADDGGAPAAAWRASAEGQARAGTGGASVPSHTEGAPHQPTNSITSARGAMALVVTQRHVAGEETAPRAPGPAPYEGRLWHGASETAAAAVLRPATGVAPLWRGAPAVSAIPDEAPQARGQGAALLREPHPPLRVPAARAQGAREPWASAGQLVEAPPRLAQAAPDSSRQRAGVPSAPRPDDAPPPRPAPGLYGVLAPAGSRDAGVPRGAPSARRTGDARYATSEPEAPLPRPADVRPAPPWSVAGAAQRGAPLPQHTPDARAGTDASEERQPAPIAGVRPTASRAAPGGTTGGAARERPGRAARPQGPVEPVSHTRQAGAMRARLAGAPPRAASDAWLVGMAELPRRQLTLPASVESQAAPTIQVTIGRIEVQATPEPAPAPARRPQAPPLTLAEYLRRRGEGGDR